MDLINPNDYWVWENKDDLLKKLKRYDEALEWLNLKIFYFFYSYDKMI